METIHISDVIAILGLPPPPQGRNAYYVTCPCCDEDSRSRHLNINLKKEVFRCPRCGVSGGIFDLYALCTHTPREKVYREIRDRVPCRARAPQRSEAPEIREHPLADIEVRDKTYRQLLSMLSLEPDHLENLKNRGLTEEEIQTLEYKTTPALGTAVLARQLQEAGCYLSGVPGFYRDDHDNWTFVHLARGILIPVRDRNGLIQGMQVRLDQMERRKFRWVSSAGRKDGCRMEGWPHLAGRLGERILLTEGPMKADVIHALTGLTVLAVPGVNSLTRLGETLTDYREQGLTTVMTAFDMDFFTNWHVQAGLEKLLQLLESLGFQYGSYVWDPRYKGLDDYLWQALLRSRNRIVCRDFGGYLQSQSGHDPADERQSGKHRRWLCLPADRAGRHHL